MGEQSEETPAGLGRMMVFVRIRPAKKGHDLVIESVPGDPCLLRVVGGDHGGEGQHDSADETPGPSSARYRPPSSVPRHADGSRPVSRRPPSAEKAHAHGAKGGNETPGLHGATKEFVFDRVFPQAAPQVDVFSAIGLPVLLECLNGLNGAILAYGQTGGGKTYSLLHQGAKYESTGLLPRLSFSLFLAVARDTENVYEVEVAALQVYNEQIDDLLHAGHNKGVGHNLAVVQGGEVTGLTWIRCQHPDEMLDLVARARSNINYAETKQNKKSSRSHAVFQVRLTKRERATNVSPSGERRKMQVLQGRLSVVDLAGSERVKKTGVEGVQLTEAKNINKSLLALGNVMNALATKQPHVPLRDSKLTRVLDGSIGGNCKTALLVCVNPELEHLHETAGCVEFAVRAMRIEVSAKANTGTVQLDAKSLLADLRRDPRLEALRQASSNVVERVLLAGPRNDRQADKLARKTISFERSTMLLNSAVGKMDNQRLQEKVDRLIQGRSVAEEAAERLHQEVEEVESSAKECREEANARADEVTAWRAEGEQAMTEMAAYSEAEARADENAALFAEWEGRAAESEEAIELLREESEAELSDANKHVEDWRSRYQSVESSLATAFQESQLELSEFSSHEADLRTEAEGAHAAFVTASHEADELTRRMAAAGQQIADLRRSAEQADEKAEALRSEAMAASALEAEVMKLTDGLKQRSQELLHAESSVDSLRDETHALRGELEEEKLAKEFEQKEIALRSEARERSLVQELTEALQAGQRAQKAAQEATDAAAQAAVQSRQLTTETEARQISLHHELADVREQCRLARAAAAYEKRRNLAEAREHGLRDELFGAEAASRSSGFGLSPQQSSARSRERWTSRAASESLTEKGTPATETAEREADLHSELNRFLDASRMTTASTEEARQAVAAATSQARVHTEAGFTLPTKECQEGLGGYLARAARRSIAQGRLRTETNEDVTSPSSEGSSAFPITPSQGPRAIQSKSSGSGGASGRQSWVTPPSLREQESPYTGSVYSEASPSAKPPRRRRIHTDCSSEVSPSSEGVGRLRELRARVSGEEIPTLRARPVLQGRSPMSKDQGRSPSSASSGWTHVPLLKSEKKSSRQDLTMLQEEDALSQQLLQCAAGDHLPSDRYSGDLGPLSSRQVSARARDILRSGSEAQLSLRTPAMVGRPGQPATAAKSVSAPVGWHPHKQKGPPTHLSSPPSRQQRHTPLLLQAGTEVLTGSVSQPSLRPPQRGFVLRPLGPQSFEEDQLLPPA